MKVLLLLIPLLFAPIIIGVIIFLYSIRGKWRNDFDRWVGFGEYSARERLGNCETRLNSIESILRDIDDKLDRHIQEGHMTEDKQIDKRPKNDNKA